MATKKQTTSIEWVLNSDGTAGYAIDLLKGVLLSYNNGYETIPTNELNWIVLGGGGKNAHPMNPHWARKIRDQCVDAGVLFFFKQWGEYLHIDLIPMNFACDSKDNTVMIGNDCFYKIGTKRAGNVLDGQVWQQIPEVKL